MQKSTFKSDPQTKATFQALVDALIPSTSVPEQAAGRTEFQVDEYLIRFLDHYTDITEITKHGSLSKVTADLLDTVASQTITTGIVKEPRNAKATSEGCIFASLSLMDRRRTLSYMEENGSRLINLPDPFKGNPQLVMVVVGAINRVPAFGFFSEWSGYPSMRPRSHEERALIDKPAGWEQTGYPRPIEAGRSFRGYLIETYSE